MSAEQSAFSRWLFPPADFSQSGTGLRVKLAGVRRIWMLGGFGYLALAALILLANPAVRSMPISPRAMALFAIGALLAIGFHLVLFDMLSPPEVIEIDQAPKVIRQTRTYLWFIRRTTTRNAVDLRAADIDSEEVRDKYGKGQGRFAFHPMLLLKNDGVERLTSTHAFSHDEAARIVAAINDMLVSADTAASGPAVRLAAGRPTTVEQINAAAIVRQERFFTRIIGSIIVCGSLALLWIGRDDFGPRHQATVVGAAPMCQYGWRFSKYDSESTSSDCSFIPRPQRAPPDMQPNVYRGFDLDVRFVDARGQEMSGRLFVTDPEAEHARQTGKVIVQHRPEHRVPVRQPHAFKTLTLVALLALSGLLVFFVADARHWLRKRGLVWR